MDTRQQSGQQQGWSLASANSQEARQNRLRAIRDSRPDRTALLAAADALAAQYVAGAAPLRFGIAQSDAELEAVYRLRYQILIERGWAAPEAFPDGLERDAYDDGAIRIAAWDGRVLAATSRLVLPTPGQRLPTEEAFGLEIEPRGRVVDVGRTCVAPAYREVRRRVLLGLLGQVWLETRAWGFAEVCGVFTASVVRLYRSQGLPVLILGAPHRYWGRERFPALIRPLEAIPLLTRHCQEK